MIAKPSKFTLPLAALLVVGVTFLGWLFDKPADTNPLRKSGEKAEINVEKRLDALYLKYPEIAITKLDPENDLTPTYEKLFPGESHDELLLKIGSLQEMLDGKKPWNAQEAREFLTAEGARLNTLIGKSAPPYHFQKSDDFAPASIILSAFRLLTTSFALQAKLGDTSEALTTYRALSHLMRAASPEGLIHLTFATITRPPLNRYASQLLTQPSDLTATILSPELNQPAPFKSTLRGECTATLSLMYLGTEVAKSGELILDFGEKSPLIPLVEYEMVMASHCTDRIKQIQKYEQAPTAAAFKETIKQLNALPNQHLSYENQDILTLIHHPMDLYFEAVQKDKFITQAQQTAVQIALAHKNGELFTGKLPLNYKTGKPIIWDKDNNLLRTGLEPRENIDYSTISIPMLPSNAE